MNNFIDESDDGLDSKYYLPAKNIGAPTSPQTANQLDEMTKLLNQGIQNIEVGPLKPETFDQMPKQHFKEMNRLAKLTDANASVHAPMIDPAGFTQQGWDEFEMKRNEEQIKSVLERSHELDDKGNVPVTLHVSSAPFLAQSFQKKGLKTHEGKPTEVAMTAVVDQTTGQVVPLKHEVKKYITGDETWDIDRSLQNINRTSWDNDVLRLMAYEKEKEEVNQKKQMILAETGPLAIKQKYGSKLTPSEEARLQSAEGRISLYDHQMQEYDVHLMSGIEALSHKFKKTFPEGKERNEIISKLNKIGEALNKQRKQEKKIHDDMIRKYSPQIDQIRDPAERRDKIVEVQEKIQEKMNREIKDRISPEQLLMTMSQLPAPPNYQKIDDFALDKTAETISNAALHAYDKFGEKAPIISLENFHPETPLSRAKTLRKAIEESRKQFAKKLVKEKSLGKEEAKKVAEKLIGATWDIAHINMLRKSGYSEEDIIKESKKIAKVVKHIHISDNFGHGDSHLPPGMGNVPIKKALEAMEKEGKLKDVRSIVEAGGFAQHFKTSPLPYALEGLGSPVYTYDTSPYWAQIRSSYGAYMMGYGDILPDMHFRSLYGAGFSGLPRELGGQIGGDRSRFSGTPNA